MQLINEDNIKQYMQKYTEDDTPGWTAIDEELRRFYPVDAERHYATMLSYMIGGQDPMDGFSIYDNEEEHFHRHIISYGMSDLYYHPAAANNAVSQWGFEFTMRVIPYKDDDNSEDINGLIVEKEPYWVMDLMNYLATYVIDNNRCFEPYHFIAINSSIRFDTPTKLVGIAFVPDTQLNTIETPNGTVQFLQLVGLTKRELAWLNKDPKTYRVKMLIDKMKQDNPLLITDLNRSKDYVE